MSDLQPFTVAILAGGKSSRMGQNKALLKIGNLTMIEHVLGVAQALNPAQILLITNTPADYVRLSLKMLADLIPEVGAAGGISTALSHSEHDAVLMMPCDTPFIQLSLAQRLVAVQQEGAYHAVVPLKDDYPQSAFAIYHRIIRPAFENAIHNDVRKMSRILATVDNIHYLPEADWRPLDPRGLSFVNVNTPDELASAQSLWKSLTSKS